MTRFMNRMSTLLATAALVVASACGGGSSSDGGITPPPPPPTTTVLSFGAITGFGSVYVNGVEYDTEGVEVEVNGEPATESDLKVGYMVQLRAQAQGGSHSADVIRYHDNLEGPISSIAADGASFVAMGQTALVSSDTTFGSGVVPASIEGLAVDDIVEVSGILDGDGAILATYVDIKPDGGPYDVSGYVAGLDTAAKRFNITALVVDYSAANVDDFPTGEPTEGDLVLVKGSEFDQGGAFLATRIELRSDDWLQPDTGDEMELQGVITDFVSASDFVVAGVRVTTTTATEYEHGTVDDLAGGVQVMVKGEVDAEGVLVARRICFKLVNTIKIVARVQAIQGAVIEALGLQVTTDEMTRYEDRSSLGLESLGLGDLAVEDWVEIRGFEEPAESNDVTASRVIRIDAEEQVELRGPFRDPAKPLFRILSVPIVPLDTTRFVLEGEQGNQGIDWFFAEAPGEIVEAEGSYDGVSIFPEKVVIKVCDD